jgi:hypothetical protein
VEAVTKDLSALTSGEGVVRLWPGREVAGCRDEAGGATPVLLQSWWVGLAEAQQQGNRQAQLTHGSGPQ